MYIYIDNDYDIDYKIWHMIHIFLYIYIYSYDSTIFIIYKYMIYIKNVGI